MRQGIICSSRVHTPLRFDMGWQIALLALILILIGSPSLTTWRSFDMGHWILFLSKCSFKRLYIIFGENEMQGDTILVG